MKFFTGMEEMIQFNVPPHIGKEEKYIVSAIKNRKICGGGPFTGKCQEMLEQMTGADKAFLTTSGTDALEMAAILADIRQGDEVIMPSYTFVSTANAFVLRGAKIVFIDIRPDTMNLDERLIEQAVTKKTKAIVPVHYAGVACEMDTISRIASRYGLKVIEDAAQGVMAYYKGRALGSIGDLGCYSFHETKNYSMGEGGAVLVNDGALSERADIIWEKGTDRSRFLRGQVDKYTWVDIGSSFLPSELNAAHLYAQLEQADKINKDRLNSWRLYYEGLTPLKEAGAVELPFIPKECAHNAHMFYIKVKDLTERTRLSAYLKEKGIYTAFHYVPLHTSKAGGEYGRFVGEDRYTTKESERLLRLPMYYGLTQTDIAFVIESIERFYRNQKFGRG